MIKKFHRREGHYPSRVLADKIYRNRENLSYCKERGIRLSGPALGRPKKDAFRDKAQDYRDECERVEVERKFSLGKRKCGMGLVTAKLEETAAHVVALSVPKNKPCKRVTHTAASRLGKQPNKATLRSDLDASCG